MDGLFAADVRLAYEDLRAFNLYHELRKGSKYRLSVMFLAGISVMLVLTLAYQVYMKFSIYYCLYILIVLLLPLCRYAVLAARTKKAQEEYERSGGKSRYDFTDDSVVRVKTDETGTKKSEYKYESYVRIVKTPKAFYLYISETEVNIIPLGSISKGTPEELGRFLDEKLGKKYFVLLKNF